MVISRAWNKLTIGNARLQLILVLLKGLEHLALSMQRSEKRKQLCLARYFIMQGKSCSFLCGILLAVCQASITSQWPPLFSANQFTTERWYSGLFVWSQSAVPVFTVNNEISYLSAFTNSVMMEISRLDALISNKMKSDFISSISRKYWPLQVFTSKY